ncbi:hypothetical protein NLK93_18815, partial [Klebsiella pneumoniae]|uniref:hypothetical protein n=1 Tax=Klebsiella pneumoniae TaxID=573 RepID=UPI0021D381B7
NGGKNSLNRLIRCVCGKKIGPDPRNFNQRVSLGRNDLLIRTFLRRPPRLFKNEGIGWALRHFRVSENDKKGTQMFLNVIVIVSPLKPTSSVFRR